MTISATTQGLRPGVCTSSNRPATPFEGQMIYETDTDLTYIYGGSAWQQVSGGTAVGNSGLVYVTSGALSSTATNFAGCFTTTYENYRIVFSKVNVGAGWLQFQMLNSTTAFASSLYHSAFVSNNSSSGSPASDRGTAITVGYLGYNFQSTTDGSMSASFDFMNPFGTGRTFFNGQASSYYSVTPFFQVLNGGGGVDSTNSFDGIRISSSGGGTLIGNVAIYGYRKA